MTVLPQGTVTFLFTDIEGSTRLLQQLGDEYATLLEEHRRVLRDAFARHGGVEIGTEGDSFFVAFAKASDALTAAREGRDALATGPIRVRMGLHTGEPRVAEGSYVGIDVHRAARIAAAGHGGQILMSQSTRDLVGADGLRDLGAHLLKDLDSPERIYQLGDEIFPPLKSLSNTNLPLPPEPLIGRKKELADVLRAVHAGTRTTTLTGPGGVGKTRFALEVAAELSDHFADGVCWVALAPVRDPKLVLPTIAAAVGVNDLEEELSRKHVLLLLDNFEQVVDAAADVASLQRACPEVTCLVTSREPLHVAGEREYPLSPLAEAPAVELLRQRAEAVTPGFAGEYGELVQLCDRLDRLPLAIELAAARTKALSVDALLQRLDQRLPLLTSRRRDVEERQQTLRATIEWSYELLTPPEQELFARLAIFAASFDLDAAEAVCSADLDVLQSLVDKSLLRHGADARYFMLGTIKELALEKLDELDDRGAVRRAHDEHFLAVAEKLAERERESVGGRDLGADSRERFERELPSFRAALAGFLDAGRDAEVLRLGAALWRFWLTRTQYRDAAAWLERAPIDDAAIAPDVRAAALAAAGALAFYVHDDVDRAEAFWQEGLALRREQDDPREEGVAFTRLASVAWGRGDFDGAIAYHEQALRLFERAGSEPLRLNELHLLGEAYRDRGDFDEAERLLEETVAVARAHGLGHQLTNTLHSLGDLALDRGDSNAALASFGEALDYGVETGFRRTQIYCIAGIACALAQRGDTSEAARLWAVAQDQERQLGFRMLRNERQRYERMMSDVSDPADGVGLTLEQAVAEARRYIAPP
jgi:predicted ATPase